MTLDPQLQMLFADDSYTRLDWDLRLKLRPLEQGLHALYATHRVPHPLGVEFLKSILGSEAREIRKFRYKLRLAIERLRDLGFVSAASRPSCPRQSR